MEPLSRNRFKEIVSLTRRKGREAQGRYLAEGIRLAVSALECDAPVVELVVDVETAPDEPVLEQARRKGIPAHAVPSSDFRRLSDVETSQGVIAVMAMERRELPDVADSSRILMLDGVQDPGNAGTIIRTAAWFGVDAVIALPGTVEMHNPKVVRGAMGGFWDVKLHASKDGVATVQYLREAGFRICSADMSGTEVRRWLPTTPAALILGSEAHGVSEAYAGLVDERIVIPRSSGGGARGGVESLNVAMAAAILIHRWSG